MFRICCAWGLIAFMWIGVVSLILHDVSFGFGLLRDVVLTLDTEVFVVTVVRLFWFLFAWIGFVIPALFA